jgi:3-hydroxyisobutyrate dehydrogenase-like beta-hydroxyacid dehydrogenase
MTAIIAIVAPGAMGSAVARRLHEHGARVLTSLAGRGAATRERAQAAGLVDADDHQLAAADIILSILPPAAAVGLAERLAPALAEAGRKPIYVDCNAVDVGTVARIAAIIGASGAPFVDGAIIGSPPRPGQPGPTFYLAGGPAADLAGLGELGLRLRIIDGPVGAASALKMAYAGITKGLTALGAAMVLAADRAGAAPALRAELAASQPHLLQRLGTALPDMYGKADRWVGEMREIAAFAGPDAAEARIYLAIADLYERIGADFREGRQEIGRLDAFLALGDQGGGSGAAPSSPGA